MDYMDYILFYGLYRLFVVIIHNYVYIFCIIYPILPIKMSILELIISKKNIVISNGIIIILYEIKEYNIVLKFKGFFILFSKINCI